MENKRLVHVPWTCTIGYVSRKANAVADYSAKVCVIVSIKICAC